MAAEKYNKKIFQIQEIVGDRFPNFPTLKKIRQKSKESVLLKTDQNSSVFGDIFADFWRTA